MRPTTPPAGTIRALTGLRFAAAIAVALYHMTLLWPVVGGGKLTAAARRVCGEGFAGVPFFFVLSGFVLAYTYRDRFRQLTAAGLWDYGVARLARVYPVYLIGLAFALTVPQTLEQVVNDPPPWWRVAALAGLAQSWFVDARTHFAVNPVAWTLSVEAFFYATLPLLVWAAARWAGRMPAAGWYALALALWGGQLAWVAAHPLRMTVPYHNWACFVCPAGRWFEFAAGVCLGLAHAPPPAGRPSWRGTLGELLAAAPLAALVLLAGRVPQDWRMGGYYTPAMMLVVAAFARERGWLSAAFAGRVPVLLGEASYSLYILHVVVLWQVYSWLRLGPYYREAVSLALMVAASLAVYRGVEAPARAGLVAWLRTRRPAKPAAAPLRRAA